MKRSLRPPEEACGSARKKSPVTILTGARENFPRSTSTMANTWRSTSGPAWGKGKTEYSSNNSPILLFLPSGPPDSCLIQHFCAQLPRRPQMQPAAMRFPTFSLALFHRNRKSYYQVFIFYSQSVCNVLLKNHGKLCTAPTFVLY